MALDHGVLDQRPCAMTMLPVAKAPFAFHDLEQYAKLIEAARQETHRAALIVLLGGLAGLRCGEILGLEWNDVDFQRQQLTVARSDWRGHLTSTKGGRVRYIPMRRALAKALAEHRQGGGSLVVCQPNGSPLTQMIVYGTTRRAAKRAGLPAPGVHVLRHTFCSHLAMRGIAARVIQELAGHESITTTQRYMHLSPTATTDSIRAMDGEMLEKEEASTVTT